MKTRPLTAESSACVQRLRQEARDTELLLIRGNLLNRQDRTLLEMVFDRGGTFEQIAQLTGQSASTVNRRFHSILKKLLRRELNALLSRRNEFDCLEIRIAKAYFMEGLSQKAITQKLGLSRYRVRNAIQSIRHFIYCQVVQQTTSNQRRA